MTFCAVGVLAGMFSDRAAFWLSDRADMFFSRKEPREGESGEPDNSADADRSPPEPAADDPDARS